MNTPATPIAIVRATIEDVPLIAPLFDGYRQFYKQPANLEGARDFLTGRLEEKSSVIFRHHPAFWFFRTLRASLTCLQNSLAQEWEASSAVHGALNILQHSELSGHTLLKLSFLIGNSNKRYRLFILSFITWWRYAITRFEDTCRPKTLWAVSVQSVEVWPNVLRRA
jgi:hypothetical protein